MSGLNFIPLTGQLGIAGTSYRLQLGMINEKIAARILKGKDVLDSYVFKDADITETGLPNQNMVVGYVLRTLTLPNINPYGIMKTTQALSKQALTNIEKRKVVASVDEAKSVELEKVPESELKRPKAKGWVKEEGTTTREEQEKETRKAFKERVAAKKEEEATAAGGTQVEPKVEVKAESAGRSEPKKPISTIKTSRKLPSIPGASQVETKVEVKTESAEGEESNFCPFCGKDLDWKFCPYCGKPLPH